MIGAVILAGGLGERLGGVRKADLRFAGKPLLHHAIAALAGQADPLLVAIGHHRSGTLPAPAVALPDLTPGQAGPVAGLAAAVAYLHGRESAPSLLACVPVDTPLMPKMLLGSLAAGLGDGDAILVRHAGQPYPTHGLWRLSALAGLPLALRAGQAPRGLRGLAQALGARTLDWPADAQQGNPFAGINTTGDLVALERRAFSGKSL